MNPGTRVLLIERPDDKYTTLRAGDEGHVDSYNPETHTVEVTWDNGSKLPVNIQKVTTVPSEQAN